MMIKSTPTSTPATTPTPTQSPDRADIANVFGTQHKQHQADRRLVDIKPDDNDHTQASATRMMLLEIESREVAARFEHIYQTASGDPSCVPWYHHAGPNSAVVEWLNRKAPCLVRPGARTVVVGCGLGDDVIELTSRGYDAMGFDVSPTCVAWARKRFPVEAERFIQADILDLPSRMKNRFDLVIEAFTIQAVSPSLREKTIEGITSLVKPHGVVMVLARRRDDSVPLSSCECAPYPVCEQELLDAMDRFGFMPIHEIQQCFDDDDPPRRCVCATFRRMT